MPSRADAAPSFLYLPSLGEAGAEIALPDDEAHYVTRVCRARAGERLQATDGRGALAALTLLAVHGTVTVRVESIDRRSPRRSARVLCGVPEGQRADWLVEKLAELGIERLVLVDCARGSWPEAAPRLERLRRVAVAALRQSRRRWLMDTVAPVPLDEAIASVPPEATRWLAAESGTVPPRAASEGLAVGAIGPAAGFDPAETDAFALAGFAPIALADGRLRCETAAVAWAGWWAAGGVG